MTIHDKLLNEIENPEVLDWVQVQNDLTLKENENHPLFETLKKECLEIAGDKDKLVVPGIQGNMCIDWHTDIDHRKGQWRQQPLDAFVQPDQPWDIIFDLDELCLSEGINWVYKGSENLIGSSRVLLKLSNGGTDAIHIREYDTELKTFIKDGFILDKGKHDVSMLNEDSVLTTADLGKDTLTLSGYPRQIRLWKRGTEINNAPIVFEVSEKSMSAGCEILGCNENEYIIFTDNKTFFEHINYLYNPIENTYKELPVPTDSIIHGISNKKLIIELKKPHVQHKVGTVLLFDLNLFDEGIIHTEVFYSPRNQERISSITTTKDFIVLHLSVNLSSEIIVYQYNDSDLIKHNIILPKNITCNTINACSDKLHNTLLFTTEGFLTPKTLYRLDLPNLTPTCIRSQKAYFDASIYDVTKMQAISKDGTSIPYTMIHKKNMLLDGTNPTLLYGYGGFEISLDPSYSPLLIKTWVEKGGAFVFGHIRGGGEFGPEWWQAALKEKRQTAYDDFASVAEDLIQSKVTSPQYLAIKGGSNGGLLMGVSFTQRPELFKAVICEVPLLVMMEYHTMLAGNSWMGEYGNPDVPEERKAILAYSPFDNVKKDKKYPNILFTSSTKDDRVHPGHARRMYFKMLEMGHSVRYHENREGGHGGAEDLKVAIHIRCLTSCFLYNQLMPNLGLTHGEPSPQVKFSPTFKASDTTKETLSDVSDTDINNKDTKISSLTP